MKKKVGIIGWRGMVGSVLMQRLIEADDFNLIQPYFFSSSLAGQTRSPAEGLSPYLLYDAYHLQQLSEMDILLSCQGGAYTQEIHTQLRANGFQGYWIDAASTLRMAPDAVIALDPINRSAIDQALESGIKDYIGGNCSITLSLLGLAGLFHADLVEWVSMITYQAASGAGAAQIYELMQQMDGVTQAIRPYLQDPQCSILKLVQQVDQALHHADLPTQALGGVLSCNVLPWIDSDLGNGISREEWKGEIEANKILGKTSENKIAIDGLCARVATIRAHCAALTLKLKKPQTIEQLVALIDRYPWVQYVPNTKQQTLAKLTPVEVCGSLKIAVGRLRFLSIDPQIVNVMTIGDQLLWGAAEPLRRMLRILLER